jgi:glycerophosphoryl diester phosphodiesterase
MVWTVNDPVGLSVMLSRGVDGIITDHPQLAVAVLGQRAALSPLERLLLYLAALFGREPEYREQ